MTALEKIVEWAATLPDWEDDIIRRLLTQSGFLEKDENEIIDFLKNDHGLIQNNINTSTPQRTVTGNISGVQQDGITVTLKELKCISGVNALPKNSVLPFSSKGLNAIYGDNGTGKSGYARVLKKACRARDTEEEILSDVFEANEDKASAIITLLIEGKEKPINWKNGEESRDELSNISVFDSKCARIILDERNNAQYLPYGTHIFQELVSILKNIKLKLEQEKPIPLKPIIDGIDFNTTSGKFFNDLSINTTSVTILSNTTWDKEKEEKLNKINKDVILAKSQDPSPQINKLYIVQKRFRIFTNYILNNRIKLSKNVCNDIEEKIDTLIVAERALEKVSELSLSNEPLKGVGSDVWQSLYNAAKDYSIKYAYKEKEFPNLDGDALCVLCMQPIDDSKVRSRFERFKIFMEDTAKQAVDDSVSELKNIYESIYSLQFDSDAFSDIYEEISQRDQGLLQEIEQYLDLLKKRQAALLAMIDNKKFITPTKLGNCPKRKISKFNRTIIKNIKSLEDSKDPSVLTKMISEENELESAKLVSKKKEEIIKYIDDLNIEKKYSNCINDINTRNVTTKGRDITADVLSPQLQRALASELEQLGGASLPVFFKVTGGEGVTVHQLHFKGIKKGSNIHLGAVLSEGEQKILAISGFLAELNTTRTKNPIVLDDPVTSLDHRYRIKIAERLIIESKKRQVIVFTHDLTFLIMLKEFAIENKSDLKIRSIERTSKKPGICTENMPWDAMNVIERIKILEKKCIKLNVDRTDLLQNEYNEKGSLLYGELRETWERLVEELLLNGVVRRFGREIQTQRLKRVTDISDSDYQKVYNAMKKCSKYIKGHDKASELNEYVPEPDEILLDIKELKTYRKELQSTRKRN